jgi:hypothetical protein
MGVQGYQIEETRVSEICYHEPVTLDTAILDMMSLCHFFSFIVGTVIVPTEIWVGCGHRAEVSERATFSLHIHARAPGEPLPPSEAMRCLISQPVDGPAYAESLEKWFCRRTDWAHSYNLATDCQARRYENSRNRYLDVLNWFESIPFFYLDRHPPVPTEVIRKAAKAASNIFHEGGITGPEVATNRLDDLLSRLNSPSLAVRLRAALAHVRERFGRSALPADSETLIKRAVTRRGAFSHGTYSLEFEHMQELYELTLLIETICGFLTLSGLDWNLTRLSQAHGHPMQLATSALAQFELARRTKLVHRLGGRSD